MIIDTHAHLNFSAYQDDLDQVFQRSLKNGVLMINVGSQYSTSQRAVELAEKYQIWAAVGLHPVHSNQDFFKTKIDQEEVSFPTRGEKFDYQKYKKLALNKRVVAIGETGLDYWSKPKTKGKRELFKENQKKSFREQLILAEELDLPVILHCRVAHTDLLSILEPKKKVKGVLHCFSGSWAEAERYLSLGLLLGFNGIIFKLDLEEVIKRVPLERILVETDCPYLTPPQESGRNEPLFVQHVLREIAKIKKINYKELSQITTKNAISLFKLNGKI